MGFVPNLLLFTICIARANCQTGNDAKNLTDHLFSEYDNRIRPKQIQTEATVIPPSIKAKQISEAGRDSQIHWEMIALPIEKSLVLRKLDQGFYTSTALVKVEVFVSFVLLSLNELDEVSETMKTTGYLEVVWTDEFLTWNPSDYGGLGYYLWPQSNVWKPDISLGNSILQYKELGVSTLNLQIDYDGKIIWRPFEVFLSTCTMDITYFPFDVQTCSLHFFAWSYTKQEVIMVGGVGGIYLDEYQSSSMWKILDTSWSVQDENGESGIKFEIKAKRKPLFYLLSIILPIILLAVLNLFVFVLPCESGERAGFSVTLFLALAVFLSIVSETLPANSETVAIFSVYVIIQTIQSTVITLVALITIRWSNNEEDEPIPSCMLMVARFTNCLCCKRKGRQTKVFNQDTVQNKQQNVSFIKRLSVTEKSLYRKRDSPDGNLDPDRDKKRQTQPKPTWKETVRDLDVLFFLVFGLVFLISTIVCFAICSTAS